MLPHVLDVIIKNLILILFRFISCGEETQGHDIVCIASLFTLIDAIKKKKKLDLHLTYCKKEQSHKTKSCYTFKAKTK